MRNCVSSLEQHYKVSFLVLKIDCALYWLKSSIWKIKLRLICIAVEYLHIDLIRHFVLLLLLKHI